MSTDQYVEIVSIRKLLERLVEALESINNQYTGNNNDNNRLNYSRRINSIWDYADSLRSESQLVENHSPTILGFIDD